MSRRYNELSITDKNGERVPVKDCRLNPLNLLIPGNAPLLVPKYPEKKKESRPSHSKVKVVMPSVVDDGDASTGYEGDQEGEGGVQETLPLIKKKKSKKTTTPKKSKKMEDAAVAAAATKTKCLKKKENSDDADMKSKEEKAQRKLQDRIDKQQAYIARLRAKYEARAKAKAKAKKEAHSSVADNVGKTDESSTAEATSAPTTTDKETDEDAASSSSVSIDSKRVRQMIKHLKIKAAGTNGAEADAFTPSEDTQLLVRKKAGESWKDIQAAMGRSKKQLQKRFKELQSQGAKAPSDDSDDDEKKKEGDGGGATTTDTENTGGDTTTTGGGAETTTDDDDTDGEKKKSKGDDGGNDGGEGGLLDMDALFGALEVLAEDATAAPASSPQIEENDKTEKKKEEEDDDKKDSGGKTKGKNKNKKEKQQQPHAKVQSPKEDNDKPAADGDNKGNDEDGIKAYLGIYAKHLLSEANAGRATIPEPDENL